MKVIKNIVKRGGGVLREREISLEKSLIFFSSNLNHPLSQYFPVSGDEREAD